MEVATGVLPSVITKLGELLVGEYKLQKEVKGGIKFLQAELESIKGALEKISNTSADEQDEQDKIWARAVRELSYDIEDKVDTFMVRCNGSKKGNQHGFKKVVDRSLDLLMQPKIRRKIATDIRYIKIQLEEVKMRRDRYKMDTINHVTPVDTRIKALFTMANELVGIDEPKKEIILKLTKGDDTSTQLQKIVSVVGFGGLGKTTLAKAVYDETKLQFDCSAFVTVSRNPNMTKILKDILYELEKNEYKNIHSTSLNVTQLIDLVREFLGNKRYFIIIDDIWDISSWENTIKLALPENNKGCRIITTTRKLTVANHIGGAYEMKPLSSDSSKLLLNRRIFGNEGPEKYLEEHLAKISDKILKKCAGVPLAIITIASLLTTRGRNQMEWYDEVYRSIGGGMENSLDAKNMRKILSYSYYDLPPHLKTCLLYLSMFPEDFEIEKDRLIWLWRAEGFIQYEEQGKSLYEIGECYFNELINRSLIQHVVHHQPFRQRIEACRVHDMVLDLLCSLSNEENFVSILSGGNNTSAPTTSRRLSIQIGGIPLSFPKVRYLGLSYTEIKELPEEVGNLQFLETLNICEDNISSLPSTIVQLKKLMAISISIWTRVPNGIGMLRSLEYLSHLHIDDESAMDHIEGLGLLTELRVLRLYLSTNKWNDNLVGSLLKLQKLECLDIGYSFYVDFKRYIGGLDQRNIGGLDDWVAPRRLRILETRGICWFSKLPAWMNNPCRLMDLCHLSIAIKQIQQKDLNIVGRLPTLRTLRLELDHVDLGNHGEFVIGAELFSCLDQFYFRGFVGSLVFHQGAMPSLTNLSFDFHVRAVREIAASSGGFDLGLGNLPALRYVDLYFVGSTRKEDFVEAEAALTHATKIHPNHPTMTFEGNSLNLFDNYETPEISLPRIGHDNMEYEHP